MKQRSSHYNNLRRPQNKFLFQSHLWGEELYTQMVFFVQTILDDRYIHRREM